jgi:folate-binding protein YgfZ
VAAGEPAGTLAAALTDAGFEEVSSEALERWRILRGSPRMGPDFGTDALPAEAGLEAAIDLTKGCFLGQESVAKVRNLGHPPRAVVPVRSRATLAPGTPVVAGGEEVGEITSAVDLPEGSVAIARVRWGAVGARLATPGGPLTLR